MSQDRPDAHELLEALEHYLRDDLLPDAPPEHRFRVRVAANVCAILARGCKRPGSAGLAVESAGGRLS